MIANADDLSCKELVELVTEYLEDRLPLDERSRFEMHLVYCAPCAVYLEQMRQTVQFAGRLSEERLPPGPKEDLLRAFRSWKRSGG